MNPRGRRCYNARMRRSRAAAIALLVAGCGSPAPPPQEPAAPVPAPPVPISDALRDCRDAAAGLERGARGLRPPGVSVLESMTSLCVDDGWGAETTDCFAQMHEGDFGRCAATLPTKARQRLFDRVGGGTSERVTVATALVKLSGLQLGIPECDHFVEVVARVLVCEAMAIEVRAQIGSEMADFWSLPTSGLPPDAQLRMADVCGKSTAVLTQQAVGAGCTL
jgi:hypothetical protein